LVSRGQLSQTVENSGREERAVSPELVGFGQASGSACYAGVTRDENAGGDGLQNAGGVGSPGERSLFASDAAFLTVADVAAKLSVSRSTVYAMVRDGELTHVRVGGLIRFDVSAVEQLSRPRRGPSPDDRA
jgi:excisionase family DNA binding protein